MVVTDTDDYFTVAVLPIHPSRGYPHTVYVPLLTRVYKFTYSQNAFDSALMMRIDSVEDDNLWWTGRIHDGGRWRIRNPTFGIYTLGFLVKDATPETPRILVWVNKTAP